VSAANPTISVNPTSGLDSTGVTVSGFGFSNNETGITVTFDGNPVASGFVANSLGAWSGTFSVPSAAVGSHTIDAFGAITATGAVPDILFTIVDPQITVSPLNGPAGTIVNVTGSGFAPGETGISITYDSDAAASGITASSSGGWTGSFTVPASASGSHIISAAGPFSLAGYVPDVTFTIPTRSITITPASGTVGAKMTINGAGFGTGENGITVTF